MFRMEGTRKNDSVLSLMRGESSIFPCMRMAGKNVPGMKNILPPPWEKFCVRACLVVIHLSISLQNRLHPNPKPCILYDLAGLFVNTYPY